LKKSPKKLPPRIRCTKSGPLEDLFSPTDGVPVEGEGLGSDQRADGDDECDVEHRRPHHAAHADVILQQNTDMQCVDMY
jgi:hypothetical protein